MTPSSSTRSLTPDAPPNTARAMYRLRWPLRLTFAGLWAERLARAFWPLWALLLSLYAALALGLADQIGLQALPWAAGVAAIAALGALFAGLRRWRRPRAEDALARLDASMPARPLTALADRQAIGAGDPASQAVWAAHLRRMEAVVAGARPIGPRFDLARRDPYALRYIALTLAVIAAAFGTAGRIGGLGGLGPAGSAEAMAAGAVWEGWVRPPSYTGTPTIYLNDVTQPALEVPQGSRVVLRFYGSEGELSITQSVASVPPGAPSVFGGEFDVAQNGRIEIEGPGGRGWDIAIIRDMPPLIEATAVPERESDGRLRLPFKAEDDFGVVAGHAEIALDLVRVDRRHGLAIAPEPRPAIVLDLPMPYTGNRREVLETLLDDLSKHPFANLPVQVRLYASDAPGQIGESAPLQTPLPGKRFFDPLAAAIIEARRDLLWSVENGSRVGQLLRAATHAPEGFIRNERAFLRLRVAIRELESGLDPQLAPELRDTLAEELWEIALLVEEGDLASALERLRRAQDRLDEAMRNGASESEIAELMQELRAALDNYMRQLAEEQARDPDRQMSDLDGLQMSGNQLQELLERLQQLMEEGRMAEAQELMEMLRQLMENMQVTQGEGGEGQGQGQNRMRDLAETLRDQQGLSDDAFRELQDQFNPDFGDPGQESGEGQQQGQQDRSPGEGQEQSGEDGQQGEGEGEGAGGDERSLAERQRDLRNRLRALGNSEFPGDGTERGQSGRSELDRAGRAMDGAEEALRDGDLPRALDRQADAMEALRQGMREFGEAMAEEIGRQGENGREFGRADPQGQRDPLGREPGQTGRIGTDEEMLLGEDVYRRAQNLLEELRRRSAEQSRPEAERDYLRRLLDRF